MKILTGNSVAIWRQRLEASNLLLDEAISPVACRSVVLTIFLCSFEQKCTSNCNFKTEDTAKVPINIRGSHDVIHVSKLAVSCVINFSK